MKIILAAIILSIFLPFLSLAAELPPAPSSAPFFNIFDSLRGFSVRIESYITPKSAKEKGFWAWIQDSSSELFTRASRAAGNIREFAENKGRKAYNFISAEIKEKIGENFWAAGKAQIENFINYLDKKIKK